MANNVNHLTHIAYADEAYYNIGRYHSIALVSLRHSDMECLRAELACLIQRAGMTEFKWMKLHSARERFAALDMLKWTIDKTNSLSLRVDVLIWDTEDSRHKVNLRDDVANMQIMYYQLFKNVMCKRWPYNSIWRLCPDEHTAMRWEQTKMFLSRASSQGLRQEFNIEHILPCKSHQEPFVQLADLYAGLAAYSRASYNRYQLWQLATNQNSASLVISQEVPDQFSMREHERFNVLAQFNGSCKKQKMKVSLQKSHGLRTFDPTKPINFWLYEPQRDSDKAPVKIGHGLTV